MEVHGAAGRRSEHVGPSRALLGRCLGVGPVLVQIYLEHCDTTRSEGLRGGVWRGEERRRMGGRERVMGVGGERG